VAYASKIFKKSIIIEYWMGSIAVLAGQHQNSSAGHGYRTHFLKLGRLDGLSLRLSLSARILFWEA
jgi:hypothetical protein